MNTSFAIDIIKCLTTHGPQSFVDLKENLHNHYSRPRDNFGPILLDHINDLKSLNMMSEEHKRYSYTSPSRGRLQYNIEVFQFGLKLLTASVEGNPVILNNILLGAGQQGLGALNVPEEPVGQNVRQEGADTRNNNVNIQAGQQGLGALNDPEEPAGHNVWQEGAGTRNNNVNIQAAQQGLGALNDPEEPAGQNFRQEGDDVHRREGDARAQGTVAGIRNNNDDPEANNNLNVEQEIEVAVANYLATLLEQFMLEKRRQN